LISEELLYFIAWRFLFHLIKICDFFSGIFVYSVNYMSTYSRYMLLATKYYWGNNRCLLTHIYTRCFDNSIALCSHFAVFVSFIDKSAVIMYVPIKVALKAQGSEGSVMNCQKQIYQSFIS
jgi:hypothetical protein